MKKIIPIFLVCLAAILVVSIFTGKDDMGIFDGSFKNQKAKAALPGKDLSVHRKYLDSLRKPSLQLEISEVKGFSKIGGLPTLPASVEWPSWKDKTLAFLCQLDLAEIPEGEAFVGLPGSGKLYFFYDQEQRTWGFDPKDRGSWRVIYIDQTAEGKWSSAPKGLDKDYVYKEKFVRFSKIFTYPDCQDERVERLALDDVQFDEYIELCSSMFGDQPSHQLFGYPSPVQGIDMDLECQLVSNGLYCGDSTGYNDPGAKELEEGRTDWVLLLQLDTDDDTGMMWGDSGKLYFWIKKEDLRKKNFDNVWMILQCY